MDTESFLYDITAYDTYAVPSYNYTKEFLDWMVKEGYLKYQTNGSYVASNKLREEYLDNDLELIKYIEENYVQNNFTKW